MHSLAILFVVLAVIQVTFSAPLLQYGVTPSDVQAALIPQRHEPRTPDRTPKTKKHNRPTPVGTGRRRIPSEPSEEGETSEAADEPPPKKAKTNRFKVKPQPAAPHVQTAGEETVQTEPVQTVRKQTEEKGVQTTDARGSRRGHFRLITPKRIDQTEAGLLPKPPSQESTVTLPEDQPATPHLKRAVTTERETAPNFQGGIET
ncbi:hypothetical protein K439DRAFT_1663254 [Ramaria rubella]|nr:hypothetical protein K439DRAFT_1663254 [Ramaria rubella]